MKTGEGEKSVEQIMLEFGSILNSVHGQLDTSILNPFYLYKEAGRDLNTGCFFHFHPGTFISGESVCKFTYCTDVL